MLRANPRVSDLIFSPGRKLQVQVNDALVTVERPGLSFLTADDTRRIASDLIGNNKPAIGMLREQGYCDVSYALPGLARFRVNVFIQRGQLRSGDAGDSDGGSRLSKLWERPSNCARWPLFTTGWC